MLLLNRPNWHISENKATDEQIYMNRRQLAAGLGAGLIGATSGLLPNNHAFAQTAGNQALVEATKEFYAAAKPSGVFTAKHARRDITKESDFATYNNFYEFGSHKTIASAAQKFKPHPWELTIEVEGQKPKVFGIEEIIKKIGLETRVYRFRCVETWAMCVPWVGFPMHKLLALADETSKNMKFVSMFTATQKDSMPGLSESWYPWPYIENLELAEAMNDLAFIAVGAYDKPLPNQNGAPLRLVVPWKYGFKNIKSIQKILFTNNRKKSFWETVQGSEYGFYANINPKVRHSRWSQGNEKLLGSGKQEPTLYFNGYEEFVASMYKDKINDDKIYY